MSARTWKLYGEGWLLDRDDEPVEGPAIRGYANATSWEITAESPYGAIDLALGEADDLDDAKAKVDAALARIVAGGPEVA